MYNEESNTVQYSNHVRVREEDTVPFTVQYTTRISSNEESSAIQYSNSRNYAHSDRNMVTISQNRAWDDDINDFDIDYDQNRARDYDQNHTIDDFD